jgi:5-methylcytosine-specific restriction protein A
VLPSRGKGNLAPDKYPVPKRTPRFSVAPATKPVSINLTGGYDGQWRKLRNRRLDAEPLCRHCTGRGLVTPAVEVDHIKPKALGGGDEWDNTQSLCKACHIEKTRTDVQRIRRGW